jgi:hypothetical protein
LRCGEEIVLTVDELKHLQVTREEQSLLRDKRVRFISTFLDARSAAACRANSMSGVCANGLCMIDPRQRLAASFSVGSRSLMVPILSI